jgi:DeoR/GlpR family transcriptional regulator of sugar metabolism
MTPRGPCFYMRRKAKMNRETLARYAGVSQDTVRRLDQLTRTVLLVKVGDVVRVADALGCAPIALLPGLRYSAVDYRHREAVVRAAEREAGADVEALIVERGAQVAERTEAVGEP